MRSFVFEACLAVALASEVIAADSSLMVPQLAKPATAATADDPLQAKYDAAWTTFEESVGNATAEVNKALDIQFEKAADAGNLDLADMWDRKKKSFTDTKTIEWPSDGKAKTEWRKKFPESDFPDDFSEIIKTAQAGYAAAVTTLKGDYESLVKEYTKERNLGRAKQVREEMAALDKAPVTPPERPRMVEEKPVTSEKSVANPARRGAEQFKKHWYKVFPEKLSWHQAKAKCEEMGGHLAVVSDAQEDAFIQRLLVKAGLPSQRMDGVWLGATDQGHEGRWVWVDGTPLQYSNWHTNQPNNKQNEEHYLMLWVQAGQWTDQPSISNQHDIYFVCEWED